MADIDGRLLSWAAFAALVAVAVATAGWGSSPLDRPAAGPSASPSASPLSMPAAEAATVTRAVDLRRRDLPAGFRRVTLPGATDPAVGDGLQLCGAAVSSQRFQVAAHRAGFVAGSGRRVRTAVVAYRHGRAAQVLEQLREASAACARPVPPEPVQQPSTLALRVRHKALSGRTRAEEVVVERREDVLVVMEVDEPRGTLVLDLARVLSERLLAQLP